MEGTATRQPIPTETKPTPDTLRMEYGEICKSYHYVRERQLKLLTFIPIASGAAASLVVNGLPNSATAPNPAYVLVAGLVGFVVTLGLFIHSLRGARWAEALEDNGAALEQQLGLTVGQFKDRPQKMTRVIGYTTAFALVYCAVLVPWAYAFYLGYKGLHPKN
jgi:hypothetical protein